MPRGRAEGVRFARQDTTIRGVLAVTMAMNLMGYPFAALIAPIRRMVFSVSPAVVCVLGMAWWRREC